MWVAGVPALSGGALWAVGAVIVLPTLMLRKSAIAVVLSVALLLGVSSVAVSHRQRRRIGQPVALPDNRQTNR